MSRRFSLWALLALALFVATSTFGWLLTVAIGPRNPDFGRFVNPPARVASTIQRNFTDFQPARRPTIPESTAFQSVLDDLAGRVRRKAPGAIDELFDTSRMALEEIPLGIYAFHGQPPTRPLLDTAESEIRSDLATLVSDWSNTFPTGRVEIRQAMWNGDHSEAVVLAKHVDPSAGVRYVRWWMTKRPTGWRVYDFDYPNTRLRFLTVRNYLLNASVHDHVGAGSNRNVDPNAPDIDAYERYRNAFEWLQLAGSTSDPAAANASIWIESIDAEPMLPYVQAARRSLRARQAALRGDAAGAEAALAVIPESLATTAIVGFSKAVIANVRQRPAAARDAIRDYRKQVGDDPIAVLEEAKAALAIDGEQGAVAVLRRGLTDFPGDVAIAMELARRLPAEHRAELGETLARTAQPEILLTAAQLFSRQFPTILDALCTGWLRMKPNEGTALAIAVPTKIALGQTKPATELLRRVPDGLRKEIVNDLVHRAIPAPSPTEFFAVLTHAGEGSRAFRILAKALVSQLLHGNAPPAERTRQVRNLKALIAAHRADDPADVQLHYAEAAVSIATGEHDKADAELAAGLAKLPIARTRRLSLAEQSKIVDDEREPFRTLRVDRLARRGRWQRAYAEVAPAVDAFDQLAGFFAAERDEFALAELIDRHANAHPDDLELIAWRAELAYLKRDSEAALKLYREYRDKSGRENRHAMRTYERMIRSLVRLNRPDEAAETLDEAGEQFGRGLLLLVLVAAARGDVDFVLEKFDSASPFNPNIWYADPDLGPLLRKPAFDRVRQKYPPPVR